MRNPSDDRKDEIPNDEDVNEISSDEVIRRNRSEPKQGPQVHEHFSLPPKGELLHPYCGWQINKAAMEEYMWNWSKQEGIAVFKNSNRNVIYWRCYMQENTETGMDCLLK